MASKKFKKCSFAGKSFYRETKSAVETKEDLTQSYDLDVKSIHEDEKNFIIEGYATKFFGIDSYGDQIRPGAYLETIAKNSGGLPAFIMHDSSKIPVGLIFEMKEDSVGLFIKIKLPKDDELVTKRLVPQLRVKSIDAFSIGFRITKVSFEEIDGEMIRILEGIDLKEVSFINKGYQADSGALITSVKKDEGKSFKEDLVNSMVEIKRKNLDNPALDEEIMDHYHELGKSNPFDEGAVISIDELKSMTKSNKVYAIRKLALSAKASNYLAELVTVQTNESINSSEGVDTNEDSEALTDSKDSLDSSEENTDETDELKKAEEEKLSNAFDDLIESLKPKTQTKDS